MSRSAPGWHHDGDHRHHDPHRDGHQQRETPEPDPELRDTESVPLAESIERFFEREVQLHVPDVWIDTAKRDPRDGEVGIVRMLAEVTGGASAG